MPLGVLRLQLLQSMSDERVKSPRQDGLVVLEFVGLLHNGVEKIYKFVFLLEKYKQDHIRFSTQDTIFLSLFFPYYKKTFSYKF